MTTAALLRTKKPGIPAYSFEPIGDRLVVERDPPEKVSEGGIALPETSQEMPRLGSVLAVGPGPRMADGTRGRMQIKVGDRVLLSPFAETALLEGHEVVLAREQDILAIVKPG